jgi:hypothetical protein
MNRSVARPAHWVGAILCIVFSGWFALRAEAAPAIQLALVIDGSNSITAPDFISVKNGLADAIANATIVPHDGSVEISVVQFASAISGLARVEVAPTVITEASVDAIAILIRNIVQAGGNTPLANGIQLGCLQITGSPNFASSGRQLVNVVSDGQPNIPLNGNPNRRKPGKAKKEAIAQSAQCRSAGIDELDAEGIGDATKKSTFVKFLCNTVYPNHDPCQIFNAPLDANLKLTAGFVIKIPNISQDFAGAMAKKLKLAPPLADAGSVPDGNPIDDAPYMCLPGGHTITLDGTGSAAREAGVTIVKFEWDLDDNGSFETSGAKPTTSCPSVGGSKTVKLRVTDSKGLVSQIDDALVIPAGPTAEADGPYVCEAFDEKITLDGTKSFAEDGAVLTTYRWDLDNNNTFEIANDSRPETTCPDPGTQKIVKLEVVDSNNLKGQDVAIVRTRDLCPQEGKLRNLLPELIQKGLPFKDLFVKLAADLLDSSDELEEIANAIEISPSDTDLDDALAQLKAIGSIAAFFQPYLDDILGKHAPLGIMEFLCEIKVLKKLLPQAIDEGKFGKTTGRTILYRLEFIKGILDWLQTHTLPILKDDLEQADDKLEEAMDYLESYDGEEAYDALTAGQRWVYNAFLDTDRALRKNLSELLQALQDIEEAFKIEQNSRLLHELHNLSVGIDDNALWVQGVSVSELTIELYALDGTAIARLQSKTNPIKLDQLMGPKRANGVYLYIARVTDKDGQNWQSKLKKIVWVRR